MSSILSMILLLMITYVWIVSCRNIHISSNGLDYKTCGSIHSPCKSLSYVSKQVLTNDSRVVIHGTTKLLSRVKFLSLKNLTFSSPEDSVAVIHCTERSGGLVFELCQYINFTRISIVDCSVMHNLTGLLYQSGILMNHSTNVLLDTISVMNSIGTGMVLLNSGGNIKVTNSLFSNNSIPYNWSTHSAGGNFIYGGAGLVIIVSACDPGAINCAADSTPANYTIHNSLFTNNSVNLTSLTDKHWLFSYGGGLSILLLWNVKGNIFNIQQSNFTHNKANCGSGMVWHCERLCTGNILTITDCMFSHNTLSMYSFGGAGIALGIATNIESMSTNNNISISKVHFCNNSGYYAAGTLIYSPALEPTSTLQVYNYISFTNCMWAHNTGTVSSAVEAEPNFESLQRSEFVMKTYFEDCTFFNNSITKHYIGKPSLSYTFEKQEGIFVISRLTVYFSGTNIFKDNHGTALYISTGSAIFKRGARSVFQNNSGMKGGAVALVGYSNIQYKNDTEFVFTENQASLVGGAVYVYNTKLHFSVTSHSCFLQYSDHEIPFHVRNARFKFDNNTSGSRIANSIFLTAIDPCRLACLSYSMAIPDRYKTFSNSSCIGTFHFSNSTKDGNEIATEGSIFNVHKTLPLGIIPGRKYTLPIQLLDDMRQDITRISVYQLTISNSNIKVTTGFNFVANNVIELMGKPGESGNLTLTVSFFHNTGTSLGIVLSPCPPGYVTDNSSCVCSATQSRSFRYNGITGCREKEEVSIITSGYWAGYILSSEDKTPDQNNLYTCDCPSGFCRYFNDSSPGRSKGYYSLSNVSSVVALESVVCTANRHKTLCSQCKENHSMYFHSNTAKCGQDHLCHLGFLFYILSEIIPITVLFVAILCFDIRLTTGPAYSLIFMIQLLQAMIISVNGAVKFTPSFVQFLYMILYSTLNLDFFDIDELSYCLWRGAGTLDMIAMKYVSVVYAITLTMGFIYVANHCSCRIKRCNKKRKRKYSVVHGLSAFIVICYFQCTRVTFLLLNRESPQGIGGKHFKNIVFWDGSLEYLGQRHLLYAIPAILCLIIFVIPLPFVLLCDPFLLKLESFLSLRFPSLRQPWTVAHNKLKPLLDSFQGTFKDHYRFFSGLYFIYRILILAVLVLSATSLQFYFLLELLLILLVTIQATVQPFEEKSHNTFALLVLSNMTLINAFTLHIYNLVSNAGYTEEVIAMQWVQMCLIYSPLLTLVGWAMWRVYKKCRSRVSDTVEIDDDDDRFPEELFFQREK